LCRDTADCRFYQINPKAMTDRCLGFKACTKQCDVSWKRPSTIFKVGTNPAKPAGSVKLSGPTYKKHAGKQCSGAAAPANPDFVASGASGCEEMCNEYGADCTGFVIPSSGKLKSTCMFKTGKLTALPGKYTQDSRDCYEKIETVLPWKYEKHADRQCKGSNGDVERDLLASSDYSDTSLCEEKCSTLGEACVGFVHVRSGDDAGKCHFRTGKLKISDSASEDDRDCYKKVPNQVSVEEVTKGNETASALPIVVSGGSGGNNGDNGGANSNGVYEFDIMRNGKPSYKRTEGGVEYVITWEETGKNDWGAVNLAGNKNAWTLKGGPHYRFFVQSEKDTPPAAGWTPRTGAAEGTLEVTPQQSGGAKGAQNAWSAPPPGMDVTGASGECGTKINGQYTAQDTLNNKPVYKNGDGYLIRFESAATSSLAKDVWVVYGNGAHALIVDSTKDTPPAGGWEAPEGSCAEGASDVKVSEAGAAASSQVPSPSQLTVSGGNGGFVHQGNNDQGGMSTNGLYTKEADANDKPTYLNGNGCEIKFEVAGEYGADKLAKGSTWVVLCMGHYRYFSKSESSAPPRSGWVKRDGAATGSIAVTSGVPSFEPVEVSGASSSCANCNGQYSQEGFYNGKPMYKNTHGFNITFQMNSKSDEAAVKYGGGFDVWLLAGDGQMRFFDISSEPSCPTTGWGWVTDSASGNLNVCEGVGCSGGAAGGIDSSTASSTTPSASGDYQVFDGCPKPEEKSLPIALDKTAKDFSSRGSSFVPPGAISGQIAVLCCKGSGADLMCTSRSDGSASDDNQDLKAKCLGTGKSFAQAEAACQAITTDSNTDSWHLCTQNEISSSGKTGTGGVCCGHGARCSYDDHYAWIKSGSSTASVSRR